MKKPHILAAIYRAREHEIGSLAALGLNRARQILTASAMDESGQVVADHKLAKMQVDLVKALVPWAGHVAPKAPEAATDPAKKGLGDMTVAELEAIVEGAKKAASDKARPVLEAVADAVSAPHDDTQTRETRTA